MGHRPQHGVQPGRSFSGSLVLGCPVSASSGMERHTEHQVSLASSAACGSPSPTQTSDLPEVYWRVPEGDPSPCRPSLVPGRGILTTTPAGSLGDPQALFPASLPWALWASPCKGLRPSVPSGRGQQRGVGTPEGSPHTVMTSGEPGRVSPQPSYPGCHQGAAQAVALSATCSLSLLWALVSGPRRVYSACFGPLGSSPSIFKAGGGQ